MFDAHIYIYIICVCSYYKGIRQMVPVSDQDMNTHLAEVSRVRSAFSLTAVCYFTLHSISKEKYGTFYIYISRFNVLNI